MEGALEQKTAGLKISRRTRINFQIIYSEMLLESTLGISLLVVRRLVEVPGSGNIKQCTAGCRHNIVKICIPAGMDVRIIFTQQTVYDAEYECPEKRTLLPGQSEILIVERSSGQPAQDKVKECLRKFVDACRDLDLRKNETEI
jgi:hypothetical protein